MSIHEIMTQHNSGEIYTYTAMVHVPIVQRLIIRLLSERSERFKHNFDLRLSKTMNLGLYQCLMIMDNNL